MHIYGKSADVWNAVNVPDKYGHLQHGLMISVVDGGLIVDFECANRRSEFVPYGSILDCAAFTYGICPANSFGYSTLAKKADIEALIRVHPDRPWMWLPGKLLDKGFFSELNYGLVEVQMGNDTYRELIPGSDQIRVSLSPGVENAVVGKDHFATRSCSLPKDYWISGSLLRSAFKERLQSRCNIFCVSIFSDRLVYLQREDKIPIEYLVEDIFKESRNHINPYSDQGLKDRYQKLVCQDKKRKQSARTRRMPKNAQGLPLPVELFVEIFQCLDTVDRVRCRRTCSLWNSILLSEGIFNEIRVCLKEKGLCSYLEDVWNPWYATAGCLLKCVNASTQRIVLTEVPMDDLTFALELVEHTLNGSRIKQLILGDVTVGVCYDENLQDSLEKTANSCSSFEILTFKNCVFLNETWNHMCIIIPAASVNLRLADHVAQMWDMLERHTDALRCDMKGFAEWILSRCRADNLYFAIEMYQTSDPRLTSHYRGHAEWTNDNISQLEVTKLSKLTLWALNELKER